MWRAAAAPLAVCVTTGDVAWRRMVATADPGAIASLAVVASGFSFALLLFHLVRIGPARRLASGAIPNEVVGAHRKAPAGPGVMLSRSSLAIGGRGHDPTPRHLP